MSFYATEKKEQKELVPAGTYLGICIRTVHIGTQMRKFKEEITYRNEVDILFEIPSECREFDGQLKPMVIGKRYTLTTSEKGSLRKDLRSWRGRDLTPEEVRSFDVTTLLGQPCLLGVTHSSSATTGKTYANITTISPVMKGMQIPERFNELIEYSVSNHDPEAYAKLPEFMQKMIAESIEFSNMTTGGQSTLQAPETAQAVADAIEAPVTIVEDENDLPF